jgi:sugar porter (SP) family MFS transporter
MLHQDRFTLFALFVLIVAAGSGLLFGYHTVILTGILNTIQTKFSLSVLDESILVSLILLGGLVGALFSGAAADRWGRKTILIFTAAIFCISTLSQAVSTTYVELLGGRFLTGIAVGIASVVSPLYLAEIAPPHFRGGFICTYQLMVAGGILLAYAMNLIFDMSSWRSVFYIGLIPSLLQLILLFLIPETPSWLMRHSKEDSAVDTLAHLREDTEWKEHLSEMKKTAAPRTQGKIKQILQPHLKRLIVIGLLLSIFQQITGVNTVFYYAPKIFSKHSSLLITFIIGLANFLFTILSVLLLDRLGRRLFLLTGISLMLVGQILLTFSAYPAAGMAGALIFVIGFAIGLGPITWVILSEIYPLKIRGKAMGLALFANWLFNYLVSLTFLLLMEKIGMGKTFACYGILSLLSLIFVYFYIPETKGKSLEEIEFLAAKGKL